MARRRPELAIALALAACHRHASPAPSAARVPAARAPIVIDGEWNDPDWNHNTLREVFAGDDGREARPYSEVRFVHDADTLYVALYASDTDIVTATDAFDVAIGALHFRVDPNGKLTPPVPGARDGVDADGTVDHPGDNDEEWKIELAIPAAACGLTGGAPVPVELARCDTPREGHRACGAWEGMIALAP